MKIYKIYYRKWDETVFLCHTETFHDAALLKQIMLKNGLESWIEEIV